MSLLLFNFALRAQTDHRAAPKVAGAKAALIPESVGFVCPCSWSSAKRLPPAATVWCLSPACASAQGSGWGGLNEGLGVDGDRVEGGIYLKRTQSPYPSSLTED